MTLIPISGVIAVFVFQPVAVIVIVRFKLSDMLYFLVENKKKMNIKDTCFWRVVTWMSIGIPLKVIIYFNHNIMFVVFIIQYSF